MSLYIMVYQIVEYFNMLKYNQNKLYICAYRCALRFSLRAVQEADLLLYIDAMTKIVPWSRLF